MDKNIDVNELVEEHDESYYCDTLNDNFDIDNSYDNLVYRFKFYFNDGSTKYSGFKAKEPLILYHAFEGFTSYDKYLTFAEIKPSLEQILQLAKDIFPKVDDYKNIYKIEIVNTANNEVLGVINI